MKALVIVGIVWSLLVVAFVGVLVYARITMPGDDEVVLGVSDGRLQPCPATPNCVSTYAEDDVHSVEPIVTDLSHAEALAQAKAALTALSGTTIVNETDTYIRARSVSRLFGYVDDVEVYLPTGSGTIHFRSASRAGRGDMGVNRRRYQAFRSYLGSPQ